MRNDLVFKYVASFLTTFLLLFSFFSFIRYQSLGFLSFLYFFIYMLQVFFLLKIKKITLNIKMLNLLFVVILSFFVLLLVCVLIYFINFKVPYVDKFINLL
ncbi:MAG: hypothetical protein Ta2D_09460 [Rickettsiales bacterium]|nr:MAG: hypothetical protein Ta2D_09460 [Rickettsiales bacterium]